MEIKYRMLTPDELTPTFFESFDRYQEVTQCWHKANGQWAVKPFVFVEIWEKKEKQILSMLLKETIKKGGVVWAALDNQTIAGFTSVEGKFFGGEHQYLQISSMHTSRPYRSMGIGKALFGLACNNAREMGAKKLYISGHPAVESQAFYKSLGCIEALEINEEIYTLSPEDCQLEYML